MTKYDKLFSLLQFLKNPRTLVIRVIYVYIYIKLSKLNCVCMWTDTTHAHARTYTPISENTVQYV